MHKIGIDEYRFFYYFWQIRNYFSHGKLWLSVAFQFFNLLNSHTASVLLRVMWLSSFTETFTDVFRKTLSSEYQALLPDVWVPGNKAKLKAHWQTKMELCVCIQLLDIVTYYHSTAYITPTCPLHNHNQSSNFKQPPVKKRWVPEYGIHALVAWVRSVHNKSNHY